MKQYAAKQIPNERGRFAVFTTRTTYLSNHVYDTLEGAQKAAFLLHAQQHSQQLESCVAQLMELDPEFDRSDVFC